MATIEKRTAQGETVYRVKVRLKGCKAQSETFRRITDARKWAQQTETSIREGRYFKTAEAKRHTLTELIDRYIKGVLPAKKDAKQRQRQLQWWSRQLGDALLSDVSAAKLNEQRDVLRSQGKGPATINRYLAAISHVFTIAVREYGWLEESPLRKLSKEKEPEGRVRYLSDTERDRLLTACHASSNPDLYPAVVLSLATGARRMEILGLRWSEVDWKRNTIILLKTKNEQRRAVPIGAHALELLAARAKVRRIDSDLIFPGQTPNQPAQLRHAWESALRAADVGDFHWHDLRHTAASYLAMNGATIHEIAVILGHKTLAMAMRYTHLTEQHTATIVGKMNAAIFGP